MFHTTADLIGFLVTLFIMTAIVFCDVYQWLCRRFVTWWPYRFKKTRFFVKRVKNMFWARYELSFKQETLFHVSIKTDDTWKPTEFYSVGTVKPGTFDYCLEPLEFDHTVTIQRIELSHMSLKPKTVLGPIHMMPGDTLCLSYGKRIEFVTY